MNNCNYNDNCDKMRKRDETCNKNVKYVFVRGLTGPTGPKGEAGIQGRGLKAKMGQQQLRLVQQKLESLIQNL